MSRLPRRLAALLEQVALSGANFLAFIWFARHLAPAEWGEFAFAYATALFAQGFQRAIVTIPMVSFSSGVGVWLRARPTWLQVQTLVQLVLFGALGAAALVAALLGIGWVSRSLLMGSLLMLPLFLHEFSRRCAIQEQRFDLLATMGAAYLTVVFATAFFLEVPAIGSWAPTLGVALGSLAALTVYWLGTGRSLLAMPARLQAPPAGLKEFAGWSVLSHLAFSGYNFGVQALLGALAGPAAVGVFHACRTLIQPVATVIGAMDGVDKPKAAAALQDSGLAGMRRVLRKSLLVILAVGLPYLLFVAFAADPLLGLAYGERYQGQSAVVLTWCLVAGGMMLSQPIESGMYVCRRTRALFYGRLSASVAALALAVPLIHRHGAAGALLAMTAAYAITSAVGWALLARQDAVAK